MKPWIFLRHGETDWNKEHRTMGQIDIPLNNEGLNQARRAANYLRSHSISHIFSSPLKRTLETAQIIQEEIKKPITIIDELKERNWGVLEGTTEHWDHIPHYWQTGYTPLKGESIEDYLRRLQTAMDIWASHELPLIIGHNGTYFGLCILFRLTNFNRQSNGVPIKVTLSLDLEMDQKILLEPLI